MDILQIDQNILEWLNGFLVGRSSVLDFIIKTLAVAAVYVILPLGLLYLWFYFKNKREATFLAFVACIFSWFVLTKLIIANLWFRPRPDLGLVGAKELVFHRPDYSFPSDHATAIFAVAFGLYAFGFKRAGHWFLLGAIIVSIARVAIGVHFPLDILGGVVSALVGLAIINLFKRYILRYLYKPIVFVLSKARLA